MSGCALVTSSTGQLQCRCVHQGTYAVLDVSQISSVNEQPIIEVEY